jgi:hypothetical protein
MMPMEIVPYAILGTAMTVLECGSVVLVERRLLRRRMVLEIPPLVFVGWSRSCILSL